MTETTQQVKYAVQRHNAKFDDWGTITPLEARARRLMRWKRGRIGTPEWRMYSDLHVAWDQTAVPANEGERLRETVTDRETLIQALVKARPRFKFKAKRAA
jgi:hypothetical protein